MMRIVKGIASIVGLFVLYKLYNLFQVDGLYLADPVTAGLAVGGGMKVGEGLFGKSQSQQQSQRQFTQFRPEDLAAIEQSRSGMSAGVQNLLDIINQGQQEISSQYLKGPGEFKFSTQPTALTQGLMARSAQEMADRTAALERSIGRSVQGPASNILQANARIASQLQQNPALMSAMQSQRGEELAQAGQNLANIEATNRAITAKAQSRTGLAGTGVSALQNQLSSNLGLGQALGESITSSAMKGRSGGLLPK